MSLIGKDSEGGIFLFGKSTQRVQSIKEDAPVKPAIKEPPSVFERKKEKEQPLIAVEYKDIIEESKVLTFTPPDYLLTAGRLVDVRLFPQVLKNPAMVAKTFRLKRRRCHRKRSKETAKRCP